jgi:nucleoside recognition membrane protein YjiH
MDSDMNTKPILTGYSTKAYLKFILLSGFGICAFFINIPLPGYQFSFLGWEFGTVGATSTMLISHLTRLIRAALWEGNIKAMPVLLWVMGIYCLADLFILRFNNFWRNSKVMTVFSIFKCIGFVFLTLTVIENYFGVYPALFNWYFAELDSLGGFSLSFFVIDRILISVSIIIPLSAAFLPFLTNYGLVDFIGVLMRRFMRPVFKLPGRAAVIATSALLSSFIVGQIGANNDYKSGRMNKRESIVVATSFTNPSIGFLIVIAINAGLMHIWNVYLWTTFLIVLIVTFIGVRIFPLSKISNDYREGVTPAPENVYTKHIMRNAVKEALDTASTAESFGTSLKKLMKECLSVLGTCATGTTFFAAAGIAIHTFTSILIWIGYIFWPLMMIAVPASEAVTASSGAVLGFIDIVLPSILVSTGEWSMRMRYMMAVVPVTSIIFLAAWIPCIMATDLPVKFSHLVIIWFQRMVISIIIASLFALILFPAGAFA